MSGQIQNARSDSPPMESEAPCVEHVPREEFGVAQERPRVLSLSQLMLLPRPKPLIAGVLMERSLACLVAPPESFKTFVVIDMACCVALGRPWHGCEVAPGDVMFVAAEGLWGLAGRVRAWCGGSIPESGFLHDRFHIYRENLDLYDPDSVEVFLSEVESLGQPKLVVIDTLARSMTGDENSSEVAGRVVAACDRVRELGATVLLVHHTGKAGDIERGSSALRSAADTMMKVVKRGVGLDLSCTKQKDAERFEKIALEMEEIELDGEEGRSTSLRVVDQGQGSRLKGAPSVLSGGCFEILETLIKLAEPGGVASGRLGDACTALAKPTYQRHLKRLRDDGCVDFNKEGKSKMYFPTQRGRTEHASHQSTLLDIPHEQRLAPPNDTPHTPPSLRGVSGE